MKKLLSRALQHVVSASSSSSPVKIIDCKSDRIALGTKRGLESSVRCTTSATTVLLPSRGNSSQIWGPEPKAFGKVIRCTVANSEFSFGKGNHTQNRRSGLVFSLSQTFRVQNLERQSGEHDAKHVKAGFDSTTGHVSVLCHLRGLDHAFLSHIDVEKEDNEDMQIIGSTRCKHFRMYRVVNRKRPPPTAQ